MQILIMLMLLLAAVLMLRNAARGYILTVWLVAAALMIGLINHHFTDALGLSF